MGNNIVSKLGSGGEPLALRVGDRIQQGQWAIDEESVAVWGTAPGRVSVPADKHFVLCTLRLNYTYSSSIFGDVPFKICYNGGKNTLLEIPESLFFDKTSTRSPYNFFEFPVGLKCTLPGEVRFIFSYSYTYMIEYCID